MTYAANRTSTFPTHGNLSLAAQYGLVDPASRDRHRTRSRHRSADRAIARTLEWAGAVRQSAGVLWLVAWPDPAVRLELGLEFSSCQRCPPSVLGCRQGLLDPAGENQRCGRDRGQPGVYRLDLGLRDCTAGRCGMIPGIERGDLQTPLKRV